MTAAVKTARVLLNLAEDLPYFGTVAKLITKLIEVCDQLKCNQDAGDALKERFCRLAAHLFDGPQGLEAIAKSRSDNSSLAAYSSRMESILETGTKELIKFTKGGFFKSLLRGSIPQETFDGLDRDMTQCLNELSSVLSATLLTEQAQMYNVVCNIQSSIDHQHGGLEGLMRDRVQMQYLAQRIGADIDDLTLEMQYAHASLRNQVSVVDENVRDIKSMMREVQQSVYDIQKVKSIKATSSLQLHARPRVDRTQLLGEGAIGKVYKGTYDNRDVAVKECIVINSMTDVQVEELSREVLMHSTVGNLPGVTRLFGANLTDEPRCMVLELADGSLHDALYKKSLPIDFTLSTKLFLAAQLCSTMAAISDLNIIHRDIKSKNVLLFLHRDGRVLAKLSDFGLTKVVDDVSLSLTADGDDPPPPKGTPACMAPELFKGIQF